MRARHALLFTLLLPAAAQADLVSDYCTGCHNQEDWAGSLTLDDLDPAHAVTGAATWEKVMRKLEAGMMPPVGQPRPDEAEVEHFIADLQSQLDSAPPHIASPALHRLNRNEYRNAIRDLLAMDLDIAALLPLDNATEGFDNVASGLGFSPALVQGYAAAAQKIARQAVGDATLGETAIAYKAPPRWRQDAHIDGLPLGTRGGMRVEHDFPLDAEYEISIQGGAGFGRMPSVNLVLTLDGQPLEPENPRRFRLPVTAGPHVLTVSLLDERRPTGVNDIYGVYELPGSIGGVEIKGPFNATGNSGSPARQRVFATCYPANDDEATSCARRVLGTLAGSAFRGPVDDAALEPVMAFYARGVAEGGFETGIQQGLARILIDPRFLFRFEEEPEGLAPGTPYTISGLELASRLSFFLWSSIPDAELLELAERGTLHEPAVLAAQVRRMLADPRAQALVENFAGQWLRLRELATLTPETPAFNDNLRQSFIEETQLFVGSVIAEDRPVTTLLDADYTFVDERLARHYGIEGVHGSYMRRVTLPADSPRRGLLGQASLLTVTSTASRTSPVIRGSWILENLLHAPVPAPPPGVETNLEGDGSVVLTSSIRERLEQHRQDPSCQGCHSVIDPVGFALENFDMIGAWRERDGDTAVDASGILADGTPVGSAADLRRALLRKPELFVSTFTEKLLTYALGRKLEYYDMPQVRAILRQAASQDYRVGAVVTALVQNPLFLQRSATGGSTVAAAGPLQGRNPQ